MLRPRQLVVRTTSDDRGTQGRNALVVEDCAERIGAYHVGFGGKNGGRIADLPAEVAQTLTRIQNDLFDVGADLCMPLKESYEWEPLRVKQEWIDELEADYVDRLERWCDEYLEPLPALDSFILPGGTPGAAHLHVARTVARRAERAAWAALEAYGDTPAGGDAGRGEGGVNPLTAKYLNRLSDLLFILGRVANLSVGGDVRITRGRRGGTTVMVILPLPSETPVATAAADGPARMKNEAGGKAFPISDDVPAALHAGDAPRGQRDRRGCPPVGRPARAGAGGPASPPRPRVRRRARSSGRGPRLPSRG